MKQVFVFDLDFTLWNTGDTFCSETTPPYRWRNGLLYDAEDNWLRLYPDTLRILETLQACDKTIAVASRSYDPGLAKELLSLFDITKFFRQTEIFPSDKTVHLSNIRNGLNTPFDQMVFFDDEQRNINAVGSLGVKSVLVPDGIQFSMVEPYLDNYAFKSTI